MPFIESNFYGRRDGESIQLDNNPSFLFLTRQYPPSTSIWQRLLYAKYIDTKYEYSGRDYTDFRTNYILQ